LLQAVLSCQLDGLRYSKVAAEQADTSVAGLRRKLVQYLRNRRGEFKDLDKAMPRRLGLGRHTFGSVPGYKATFKGLKWYYLTADQLKAIIGGGENAKGLKQELSKEGLLATRPNGKYLVQRPIFSGKGNEGYEWVHAFRAKILQASAEG